jgi:hypothetical protein
MERGVDFTALAYDLSEEGLARINQFVDALEDILVYMGKSKTEIGGKPNTAITETMIVEFLAEVEGYLSGATSTPAGYIPSDEEMGEWLNNTLVPRLMDLGLT